MRINIFNREIYYFIKYVLPYRRRILNIIKIKLSSLFKLTKVIGYPITVRIEPANICNLKCPLCPVGLGLLNREKGVLSLENAKKVIDEISDYAVHLRLFGAGEPLLNKELFRIISYAKSKNLIVNFHTNANFLDEENVKKTVGSGLDELVVSLDGVSQESYSMYRQGGDFDKVVSSLKLLVREKKIKNQKRPFIIMKFIIMRHNEHEVPLVRKLALDAGVDKFAFSNVWIPFEFDANFTKQFLPLNTAYSDYYIGIKDYPVFKKNRRFCYAPWEEISIDWEGSVFVCCFDLLGISKKTYINGNVFGGETIGSLWNGNDYILFRKNQLKERGKIPICARCPGYGPFGFASGIYSRRTRIK